MSSDDLMEVCSLSLPFTLTSRSDLPFPPPQQCVRDSQASLRKAGTMKRAKSVYHSKNLGTIKKAKKDKKDKTGSAADSGNADIILRILRMRYVPS